MTHPNATIPLAPDDQFMAASVTKMITATGLMLLYEEGRLDLDAKVGHYLPEGLLAGLHVFEGCSYEQEITVRQLLNHTSGIADFFGDGNPGKDGFPPFIGGLLREPEKFWTPVETLRWTKQFLRPICPPGQRWHYSDTGYLLIGLLIEALAEKPFHEFLREKIFDPLKMPYTYLLFRESPRSRLPGRSPSPAYMGKVDCTGLRSISADWAGGGLITTAPDLGRFLRAYIEDRIFRNRSTKSEMLTWISTGEEGVYYGLGVRRFLLDELGMPGVGQLWGHTGFVKSFMLYCPEQDMVLCGTFNHSDAQGVFSRFRPVSTIIPETIRHFQGISG
jgi:CubicO group peptidase (beta-lactamase class C family)